MKDFNQIQSSFLKSIITLLTNKHSRCVKYGYKFESYYDCLLQKYLVSKNGLFEFNEYVLP